MKLIQPLKCNPKNELGIKKAYSLNSEIQYVLLYRMITKAL